MFEQKYADLVADILAYGQERQTRNAITRSKFGGILEVELPESYFPLLLGRKMFYAGVFGELAAFLKGPKSLKDFTDEGCNYWGKWANDDGTINVDYGNAWLDFGGVNQLAEVVRSIKSQPSGRRHIVTGWNPGNLDSLSLPCCHLLYQWYVNGDKLEMIWYQRSVDMMIGLPSDIILAYLLNILMAADTGYKPGKVTMMLGDMHIYEPHYDAAIDYINRVKALRPVDADYPKYSSKAEASLTNFNADMVTIGDYYPASAIKMELLA